MFRPTQQAWSIGAAVLYVTLTPAWTEAAPKSSWVTAAVGTMTVQGSATTSPSGRLSVTGEGTDIWSTSDGFQFLYQRLSGDRQITVKITSLQNTDGWAKGGIMIRQALTGGSVHASLLVTPSNGIVFEQRPTAGALTTRVGVEGAAPSWLRLARAGAQVTASVSSDGSTWVAVGTQTVPMSADVLIGMVATSRYPSRLMTATFERAAITAIAAPSAPPAALTLTCPQDVTITATSPTAVTLPQPTVTGGVPPITTGQTPASGSIFPMGTSPVDVTAVDSAVPQISRTCRYSVTLVAPTAPIDPTWVQLAPGASIQAAVDSHTGATTFYLLAGTHVRQQVRPKTGNRFIGASGAILDGQNVAVYAFEAPGGANGVVVRNLTVRNYQTGAQRGAFQGDGGSNWILEDLVVHNNQAIGIRMGPGWLVRRSTVYRNGVIGISGFRSNGAVVEDNVIYENNYLQAPELPVNAEAAGIKLGETGNYIIRRNNVHHNLAKGIWVDHCLPTGLIDANTVSDNSHQGIFVEITYQVRVVGNRIERNAVGQGWPRAGITVVNSPDVEVATNTLTGNGRAVIGFQATGVNASTGAYGPLRVVNLHVHDNTVRLATTNGSMGLGDNTGEMDVYTTWNNRFVNNTYSAPTNSSWFAWNRLNFTFSGWQGQDQDATGALTLAP